MIIKPGVDFTDVRNWPAIGDMTWSGYQKKKLFRNLGDGTFKEMAQRGRRRQRPRRPRHRRSPTSTTTAGSTSSRPTPTSRRSSTATGRRGGHWVELALVGTRSNRDAIGARVTVTVPAGRWDAPARGQRRQRLRQPEQPAPPLRPRRGEPGGPGDDPWPGGPPEVLPTRDGKPPLPLNAISRIVEGTGVQ